MPDAPPDCGGHFRAMELARVKHFDALIAFEALKNEAGAKPGNMIPLTTEQSEELERLRVLAGASMDDWMRRAEIWLLACRG